MNTVTQTAAAEPVSGIEMFVPLTKLKKSPHNARKVPHSEATIEALAASIQHKGMIQNLVIEPEVRDDGTPTGCYLVTAGEGRRQAQLLRAKRKQIRKTQPIRCYLDTENDPAEISLDENVTREAMHPADQFERFRELAESKGYGAQEIGARFGVSATVVKQRLRLGAVSPRLLQVYRENGLTLDQLMAFAITEDHTRQEQVFESLHHNREPWIIRRDMTASNVPGDDRRALFVGTDAYVEAGGTVIRDLFGDDRGGFFEDAGLLDMLAIEKLREVASEVQGEGWKWAEAHIDYPHAHGMRRVYPQPVALSDEDEARLEALSTEHDTLAEGYSSYDEMPEDLAARLEAMSDEIDAIGEKRSAYAPQVIANGGVFVILNHDGTARIERGFVRAEDMALTDPKAEDEGDAIDPQTVEDEQTEDSDESEPVEEEDEEPGKPISDSLTRDLSAHRTLALRVALAERPDMALIALTHTLSFATNDERTAKRVSDALGTATEMRAMKNYAGHRLSPWLGHLMVSRSETARQLLTPGEVMQLPPDDEIVMVAGVHPIRAKKARYFRDPRLAERIMAAPDLAAGTARPDDWTGRAAAADPADVARIVRAQEDAANGGLPPRFAFHHPTGRTQMIHALRHGARRAMLTASASLIALTFSVPAYAGGSSMPWEAPLQSILESIEGPVAKIIAVIIIIVTGLTLAFGDTSGGSRKLIQIVFGLSIAFAASSFFLSFFSFGGGALV